MPETVAASWEVILRARETRYDAEHRRLADQMAALASVMPPDSPLQTPPKIAVETGFILTGPFEPDQVHAVAGPLLADAVTQIVQTVAVDNTTDRPLGPTDVTVTPKPGVMDPPSLTATSALQEAGLPLESVRSFRRYHFPTDTPEHVIDFIGKHFLYNQAIEQLIKGPITEDHLATGAPSPFVKVTVPMRGMDDDALKKLSVEGQLWLNLPEMRTIRDHFENLGRNPTDVELETIAQTWSEHCSHKTLRGPYEVDGKRSTNGLLKDTVFAVTKKLDLDWCVSVFADNAGVIKFDDDWNVCFKVETHNHPSAIEPYGGANTGLGGVIRDPLGTGLGAKPICNTDVFCVAPLDTPQQDVSERVLHPQRILRGIVAGGRDYGNRMGIPTVNGALCVHPHYLGNPLVYCGTVGLMPADKCFGDPQPGDLIVAMGGRTGRDGIHGATFSSGELSTESETLSGGAVQIGNAITEKKVVDVLLQARDENLFHAVTDCGAGGFSTAVGEMGEKIGAVVRLDAAPLKYSGLTYTEIWISEAQERMVLAVPQDKWDALKRLADSEDVETTVLGHFEPSKKLTLLYQDEIVGEVPMQFLHEGRPKILRKAHRRDIASDPWKTPDDLPSMGQILHQILASPDVCSKEWIIRQYDHEVQAGSIVKPLVGINNDGPGDASVITPVLGSWKGLALANGINPHFGERHPYNMAASAIDEALRNVVAVGGDPSRTAILDNFSWGNTARPEVFGDLLAASYACHDVALEYQTPFISGKDSLNNEFHTGDDRIAIPPTLLISALAIVPDVRKCITMDLKQHDNALYILGLTHDELAGSHCQLVTGATGGRVPAVQPEKSKPLFHKLFDAIQQGLIRSAHDLSEGGLAVAAAEMAFAGGLGLSLSLDDLPLENPLTPLAKLFSESNTRWLLEIQPDHIASAKNHFQNLPFAQLGTVTTAPSLVISDQGQTLINEPLDQLKATWQQPLAW